MNEVEDEQASPTAVKEENNCSEKTGPQLKL